MLLQWISLAGLVMLMLTGCAPPRLSAPTSPVPTTIPPTPQATVQNPLMNTPPPAATLSAPPPEEKYVALAQQELAAQLGVTVDQITTAEVTALIWPDAALGCPSPGKVYAQGRVPGYKIVLQVNGVDYSYHTDQAGNMILCPEASPDEVRPTAPAKAMPTPTIHIGVPIK